MSIIEDLKTIEIYSNSPKRKMENANVAIYAYPNGKIEVIKNRYGQTGIISHGEGTGLLINLLARTAYNNTCEVFQEALKKDLYKVLEKHKVLEGE